MTKTSYILADSFSRTTVILLSAATTRTGLLELVPVSQ